MLKHLGGDWERGNWTREQSGCLKPLRSWEGIMSQGFQASCGSLWDSVPNSCMVALVQVLLSYSSPCNKVAFWRGKAWLLYFSLFALMSSQEHWSSHTTQENLLLLNNWEHIWYARLFSLFIFRVVIKAWKKHEGKPVNFSTISIHLQRANCLEFLLPRLKLETLTTAGNTTILTWQTKPNSMHLQLCVPDVSSCGQRVSLFSVFHPETTFCKWRENHCWIKGNPCHRD